MNGILFRIVRWKLTVLARCTLWRYRPGIVGVTGSVGKTSTKFAIAAVLSGERRIRAAQGNLNGDIGIPLTVLGVWSDKDLRLISRGAPPGRHALAKIIFFTKVIVRGIANLVHTTEYPEILVLEYGIDRPGDMRRLLAIARPTISILTAIGKVPAHVEFFNGPEELAREKARLIDCLPVAGCAILNYDDTTVMDLKERTRAHVVTFGFGNGAEVRVTNFENRIEGERPVGIGFKLTYGGSSVPVRLTDVFGHTHAYAAASAAAVGIVFGMNPVKIAEALKAYRPAKGRMQLIPGVKGVWVMDDSYNASPLSMRAALETLYALPGKRKIAVLGDMLEIGAFSLDAHQELGRLVAQVADVLVTVGPQAKFIAEGAKEKRMPKRNSMSFGTAAEAAKPVEKLLKKGDLVLIKASRAIGLEKIVEEIKAF